MSTEETRRHVKFARKARNWGISALVATTIGGYALYQRSAVSADALPPLQANASATTPQATPEATTASGLYQDGEYAGDSVQAGRFGSVQLTAVIQNGQLTDFKFSDYPHDRSLSLRISQVALPYLMQEAIQTQSASVDIISGATFTSQAFMESLQSALDQAATGATATPTPAVSTSGSSL